MVNYNKHIINLPFTTAVSISVISNHNSSECCLTELLPYILLEKYIDILALEMASPGNQLVRTHVRSACFSTG